MKTPVQQLMTELRELHPEFFDVHSDKGRQFLNNFHKYIAIEKEQICNAATWGLLHESAEKYYNQTFNS
jgi:hypothetical protein